MEQERPPVDDDHSVPKRPLSRFCVAVDSAYGSHMSAMEERWGDGAMKKKAPPRTEELSESKGATYVALAERAVLARPYFDSQ